jgi:hypothetical protein
MLYSPATGGGLMTQPLIRIVELPQQPDLRSDIEQNKQSAAFIHSLLAFFH